MTLAFVLIRRDDDVGLKDFFFLDLLNSICLTENLT